MVIKGNENRGKISQIESIADKIIKNNVIVDQNSQMNPKEMGNVNWSQYNLHMDK